MEIRESKTRITLINDIKSFLIESLEHYNADKTFKRTDYLSLETRISNLNNYNFESEVKYNEFLKFINQPELQVKRHLTISEYTKNPIREVYFKEEDPHFLRIHNYLIVLKDWLR